MEVVWKVVAVITNRHFTASITFHDVLHSFRADCGTGTASLDAKLLQQLADLTEEVLYAIFMELQTVYFALNRYICMEILEGYGLGPWFCRIFREYWYRLWALARVGGYYRATFKGFRGVTQVDPLYPTIFNVVVDSVV